MTKLWTKGWNLCINLIFKEWGVSLWHGSIQQMFLIGCSVSRSVSEQKLIWKIKTQQNLRGVYLRNKKSFFK